MATLKQRVHRYNGSSYDTVHYETSSDIVIRPNGTTVEETLESLVPSGSGPNTNQYNIGDVFESTRMDYGDDVIALTEDGNNYYNIPDYPELFNVISDLTLNNSTMSVNISTDFVNNVNMLMPKNSTFNTTLPSKSPVYTNYVNGYMIILVTHTKSNSNKVHLSYLYGTNETDFAHVEIGDIETAFGTSGSSFNLAQVFDVTYINNQYVISVVYRINNTGTYKVGFITGNNINNIKTIGSAQYDTNTTYTYAVNTFYYQNKYYVLYLYSSGGSILVNVGTTSNFNTTFTSYASSVNTQLNSGNIYLYKTFIVASNIIIMVTTGSANTNVTGNFYFCYRFNITNKILQRIYISGSSITNTINGSSVTGVSGISHGEYDVSADKYYFTLIQYTSNPSGRYIHHLYRIDNFSTLIPTSTDATYNFPSSNLTIMKNDILNNDTSLYYAYLRIINNYLVYATVAGITIFNFNTLNKIKDNTNFRMTQIFPGVGNPIYISDDYWGLHNDNSGNAGYMCRLPCSIAHYKNFYGNYYDGYITYIKAKVT